ncbi:MAG: cupin domain-containing protein [Planctomycetes bacterium]|nr:cupin domain-containing protein [Planctomycetota bacterium]
MEIINRDNCEPFTTKDTSEIREIMAYRNSSCKKTSLAEATLYPGKCTEAHYHPECEEIYYILSGTGRICVDGEERDLAPGDAVLLSPGAVHQTWNTGADKLVFLCICDPPYEHEDTVMVETGE